MHHALEERPDSKCDSHKNIGSLEPVEVGEEVASQFHIIVVVESVGAEGAEEHSIHEEDGKGIPEFGGDTVAEHHIDGSEAEEGEVLDIVLEEKLEEDKFEGVGSEVFADFIVEEEEEESVEQELHCQCQGDGKDEEVEQGIK